MEVITFFVSYTEAAVLKNPGKGGFDHPPVFPEPTAVFGIAFGKKRCDAAIAQRLSHFLFRVIGAIRENGVRLSARTSARARDPWISSSHLFSGTLRTVFTVSGGQPTFARVRSGVAGWPRTNRTSIVQVTARMMPGFLGVSNGVSLCQKTHCRRRDSNPHTLAGTGF